jgi:inositol-polyphosphate multikinase
VLLGLLTDLEQIRLAVRSTEMRMVGGSILVIYEADWDTLKQGLHSLSCDTSTDEDDVDDDADAERDSNDAEDSDDEQGPPYLIKLIDFGHTRLREGEGPDAGVILGLDTTISLFKNRFEELAHMEP